MRYKKSCKKWKNDIEICRLLVQKIYIITMKEFAEEQCSIQESLDFSLKLSEKQLEIDYLKAEKETLEKKHELLMQIKDNENEILRSHINPKRTMWVFFGGFLVGTASSLATYYAVNEISEN